MKFFLTFNPYKLSQIIFNKLLKTNFRQNLNILNSKLNLTLRVYEDCRFIYTVCVLVCNNTSSFNRQRIKVIGKTVDNCPENKA